MQLYICIYIYTHPINCIKRSVGFRINYFKFCPFLRKWKIEKTQKEGFVNCHHMVYLPKIIYFEAKRDNGDYIFAELLWFFFIWDITFSLEFISPSILQMLTVIQLSGLKNVWYCAYFPDLPYLLPTPHKYSLVYLLQNKVTST